MTQKRSRGGMSSRQLYQERIKSSAETRPPPRPGSQPLCLSPRSRPLPCCPTSTPCSRARPPRSTRSKPRWRPEDGAPVFTVEGRYRARGWTEWTQGFQFGSALLQFDATGDAQFLELGRVAHARADGAAPDARRRPRSRLQQRQHLRHAVAAGARRALRGERRGSSASTSWRCKVSGAVQARRWTRIPDGGYIYSFNGAHSLFVDTIRSLRALALVAPARPSAGRGAGRAGQPARAAGAARARDRRVQRLLRHAAATPTTCAAAPRTRASSTSPTAPTAARAASRATRRSRPGRAAWPGRCSASPSSSSSSPTLRRRRARRRSADAPAIDALDARGRARDLRLLHRRRGGRRRRAVLGHRRARARRARRLGRPRRPIRSTITSRSTAPRRRSRAQGLLRLGRCLDARGERRRPLQQAGLRVLDTLFDDTART